MQQGYLKKNKVLRCFLFKLIPLRPQDVPQKPVINVVYNPYKYRLIITPHSHLFLGHLSGLHNPMYNDRRGPFCRYRWSFQTNCLSVFHVNLGCPFVGIQHLRMLSWNQTTMGFVSVILWQYDIYDGWCTGFFNTHLRKKKQAAKDVRSNVQCGWWVQQSVICSVLACLSKRLPTLKISPALHEQHLLRLHTAQIAD